MRANDSWRGKQRGWRNIAYCPEPGIHPDEPLPVVIERVFRPSDTAVLGERGDEWGPFWRWKNCGKQGTG